MSKEKEYKEIQFPKGAASVILGGMNDIMNNGKPKRVNANGTKKKTGTTSQKRSK